MEGGEEGCGRILDQVVGGLSHQAELKISLNLGDKLRSEVPSLVTSILYDGL